MRFIISLFLILVILNITYGQNVLTRCISYQGNDFYNCGSQDQPCKSIKYALSQINPNYYGPFSIEMLLSRGRHYSSTPTNLYGYNITIAAENPEELVEILISPDSNVYSVNPQFVVEYPYDIFGYAPRPTNILFKDITVTQCQSSAVSYIQSSLLESKINQLDNPTLNVKAENVNFACSYLFYPYFSVGSNYNSFSSESSSNNQESSSYNDDVVKKEKSYPYDSSSSDGYNHYSSEDSSSSDNYNYDSSSSSTFSYITEQTFGASSYPSDKLNITFTINNCQFGTSSIHSYVESQSNLVLLSEPGIAVELKITQTNFTSFNFLLGSIATINSGRLSLKNVDITNFFIDSQIQSLFNVTNARVTFDQVNLIGQSLYSSIVSATNSFVTFNQFNAYINFNNVNSAFSFIDSFASFENSSHIFYTSNQYANDGTQGIYSAVTSDIYLFSNRISSNVTNVVYSLGSNIWANNNIFKVDSSYNMAFCEYNSKQSSFHGDYQFINAISRSGTCKSEFAPFDMLALGLSFCVGVISITLVFIFFFSISAICKCRRRKQVAKRNFKIDQEKQKLLISIQSDK